MAVFDAYIKARMTPRAGDIGEPLREIETEPLEIPQPVTTPAQEPIPA